MNATIEEYLATLKELELNDENENEINLLQKYNLQKQIATEYFDQEAYENAAEYYIMALNSTKNLDYESIDVPDLYYCLARTYLRNDKADIAEDYLNKGLDYCEQHNISSATPNLLRYMGVIQADKENWNDAVDFSEKAIEKAKQQDDNLVVAQGYSHLGDIYYINKQHQIAIKNYLQSITYYEFIGDYEVIGTTYLRISDIFSKHEKRDEAIESYKKAINCFQKVANTDSIGIAFKQIASIMEQKGQISEAIENYVLAAESFIQTPNFTQAADCYHQAGFVCKAEKKWTQALMYYEKALPYAQQSVEDDTITDAVLDSISQAQQMLNKTTSPNTMSEPSLNDNKGFIEKLKDWFK